MRGFARSIVALAVAGTLPASAILAGQAPKAQAPFTVIFTPAEKGEVKKEAAAAKPTVEVKADDPKIEIGAGKATVKVEAKAKAAGVAKAAAVAKVAPPVVIQGQNLDPWIQRFVLQLKPMVRSEIHLIVTACKPTKEQKTAIAAEAERVLKDVSRACAEAQMGVGRRTADFSYPDPNRLIAEAMAVVAKEKLSAEQVDLYRKESEAKVAAFRRTAVDNLVANLDDELILSEDQRARLVETLRANWKDGWCNSLQVLMYGNQFFPKIPDEFIVPILNPTQKAVWEKKPKNNNVFWGNFGVAGNNVMIDEADEAAAAKEAAPR